MDKGNNYVYPTEVWSGPPLTIREWLMATIASGYIASFANPDAKMAPSIHDVIDYARGITNGILEDSEDHA